MFFSSHIDMNGTRTTEVTRHKFVEPSDIPALAELHSKLMALGWQPVNPLKPLQLSISERTINGQPLPLEYYLVERRTYRHESYLVVLSVDILQNNNARFFAPEQATQLATVKLDRLWYTGPALEPGKGQITFARELAKSFIPLAESLPLPVENIVIPCHTRGGRGGWKAKIAHKAYTVAELKAPPAKTRAQQYPSIRCPVRLGTLKDGQFNMWWRERVRSVFLRPNCLLSYYTYGETYAPTDERLETDWRVCRIHGKFTNPNSVLLLKEADYQRLTAKAEKQC